MNSSYPPYGTNTVYMNPGNKYTVTLRIVINTNTSASNGIMEMWVDGVRVYAQNNRKYWGSANDGSIDYYSICHFYGGGHDSYYPTEVTYGYIDNVKVWTPKSPVVTGNVLHPTSELPYCPNSIAGKDFLYDDLVTVPGTLRNAEYGTNYSDLKDETWLIDAGVGSTVHYVYTYSISGGSFGWGDYLLFYDGKTTDSPLLVYHNGASGSNTVSTTGRYLFVRFVTDKEAGSPTNTGFTGALTFN